MSQSTSDAGNKRTRNLLLAVAAILSLLIAALFVIKRTGSEPTTEPPIADACWDQLAVQQKLAELAIRAMEVYGRIDPALYDVATEEGRIQVSPGVQPIEPKEGAAPLQRFQAALQAVNEDKHVRQSLREGHAQAVKACADHCPPNVYPVDLQLVSVPKNPDAGFYRWKEKDKVPTDPEWTLGFLNLYGGAPIASCPFAPPLELIKALPSELEHVQTPPLDQKKLGESAPGDPLVQSGTLSAKPPRNYASGTAATAQPCTTTVHTSCDGCKVSKTVYGSYYYNSDSNRWCCGGC